MLKNIYLLIIILIILIHFNNINIDSLNKNSDIIINNKQTNILLNENIIDKQTNNLLNENINEIKLINNKIENNLLQSNKDYKNLNKKELNIEQLNKKELNNQQLNNEQLNNQQLNNQQLNNEQLNNEQLNKKDTEYKILEFDKPNPWTKIIFDKSQEYYYNFYIKIKIPSLNDYQAWKKIIPNIDFLPKTGELIIPSKDEQSALAIANLIISNLMGYLSMDDIIEKKLIQISISKCKSHEIVQNKIRQQIIDILYPNYNNQPHKIEKIYDLENKQNNKKNNLSKSTYDQKNDNIITPHNDIKNKIINNDLIEPYINGDSSYAYL
jgi:hypothetical protein